MKEEELTDVVWAVVDEDVIWGGSFCCTAKGQMQNKQRGQSMYFNTHLSEFNAQINQYIPNMYLWLLVWSDSGYLKRSSAVVTAAAVGCVSALASGPVPVLLAVLHVAAASASSACAISETTSETWWDSKPLPVAQPEQTLLAVGGAVSLQLVLGILWKPRWRQERKHW